MSYAIHVIKYEIVLIEFNVNKKTFVRHKVYMHDL